jgi:four helix bundle protein
MPNKVLNSKPKYDLEERTAKFGEDIINFLKTIPDTTVIRPIKLQLVRSATSVGANYCEADGADTKKDFAHKIGISKREAKGTKYWLRMLATATPENAEKCRIFAKEVQELVLIFASIIRKTKDLS